MNDPLVGVLFVIVTVSAILVQNVLLGFAKYRKKLQKKTPMKIQSRRHFRIPYKYTSL